MKRLAIYFFYDQKGIVDDYIPFLLKRLKPFCQELCVVVNGNLTPNGHAKLTPYCEKILTRPNIGFDAHAYKYALEYYGYEHLAEYDEVLLLNFTFFGPFFPLENIFHKMDNIDCDWWGPYKWPITAPIKYAHLPSFWTAYRKKLVTSKDFRHYWETLHPISNYYESVLFHEQRQTPYYDARGYKAATWLNYQQYRPFWHTNIWPLVCADRLVINDEFPFIKRRNFYIENGLFTYPSVILNLLPFLSAKNNYDLQLIHQNIFRTQPPLQLQGYFIRYARYWLMSKIAPQQSKRKHYIKKLRAIHLSMKTNRLFLKLSTKRLKQD